MLSEKPKILYVDDEEANLEGFKYTFRGYYELYLVEDPEKVFDILNSVEIEVIIADQRMPVLTGTELLEKVSVKHPDITRIILTAFTDSESILEAINMAKVYRFLTKPWNKDDLKITIDSAVENYRLKRQNNELIYDLKITNEELTRHKTDLEQIVEARTFEIKKINHKLEESNLKLNDFNEELSDKNDTLQQEISERKKIQDELKKVNLELQDYKDHLEDLVNKRTNELEESREELSKTNIERNLFFNNSVDMLIIESIDGNLRQMNPAVTNILGYSFDDLKKNSWKSYVVPDDYPKLQDSKKKYTEGKIVENLTLRITTKNNEKKWISWNIFPVQKEGLTFSVARDISEIVEYQTDLKQKNSELLLAEDKLRSINEILANRNEELNFTYNKIKLSEKNYREIFNASIDGIAVIDYDIIKVIDVNDTFLTMNHITQEDLGNVREIIFNPHGEYTFEAAYQHGLEAIDKGSKTIEWVIKRKDNTTYWAEVILKKVMINDNDRLLVVIRDISDRKKAEKELRIQKERYRTIFENSPLGIYRSSISNKYVEVNPAFVKMLGYDTPEEALLSIKQIDKDVFYSPEKYRNLIVQLRTETDVITDNFVFQRKNGSIFIANVYFKGIYNSQNELIYIDGILEDVTEKKKFEEEIIRTNNLLEKIINTSPNIVSIIDVQDGKFHFVSPKCKDFLGYKRTELLLTSNPMQMLLLKDDAHLYTMHLKEISEAKDNDVLSTDCRFKHKSGETIWVNITDQVFERDDNGKVQKLVSIITEITTRKIAEQQLKESEEKFRNIYNNSMDGILILDSNKRIIDYNNAFLSFSHDINSKTVFNELILPEYTDAFNKSINENGMVINNSIELEIINNQGKQPVFAELNMANIYFQNMLSVIIIIRNITERKNFERKMLDTVIQTEEKEREKFAKNLHDDLGPLLSSIKMYINSFETSNSKEKQKYIIQQVNDILKESIQTTKDISNDLSPHILTNYGLVSAIEAFIAKLNLHVKIDFANNIKNQRFNNATETTFYRIVKELINNTIKHADAGKIKINLVIEGKRLKLSYSDDGIGISENLLDQKNPNRGMGLFNLKSRIQSLNGKFIIKKQNKGSSFVIEAPIKNQPIQKASNEQ